jgi:hypothetical protein
MIIIPPCKWRLGGWTGVTEYGLGALWVPQWGVAMPVQYRWRRLLQYLPFTWSKGNVWERGALGNVSSITGGVIHHHHVMTVIAQCLGTALTVCNLILSQYNKILKEKRVWACACDRACTVRRRVAFTVTCTASSSSWITSVTFSLSRAFSPCSSTSSHSLISFARLWYTLFVAETSVELKGRWHVQAQGHSQVHNSMSHTHTHLCSLRTYDLRTPWIVVTVSRTMVPLPANISSFFFVTTSWKCFKANCTCCNKAIDHLMHNK